MHLGPHGWGKAAPRPASVGQVAFLVVAEDKRIETMRARRVAADNECLFAINPHLPGTRPPTGLVPAIQTFRYEPFEPMRSYRLDEDVQGRIEYRQVAY
jgi:hypothetical protein